MDKCNAIVAFAIKITADDFYQQCDSIRIDFLFGQHGIECSIAEELKSRYHVGFTRIETDRTIFLFYPLESLQKTLFGSPAKLNVDRLQPDRIDRWKDELRHAFDEILHLKYSEPEWYIAAEAFQS